jgi:tRNA (cytidine/uridine-2'-O-)-methyltransferase
MHVVLVEPEIPPNTGNIARLCAGTDTHLHLVKPLGFSLEDRYLKRAGLDYWPHVTLSVHESLEEVLTLAGDDDVAFFSTHAERPYTAFQPPGQAWLVFGKETAGLGDSLREREGDRIFKIPINHKIRSLNLSNAVAVALYEVLRQQADRQAAP